MVVGNPWVGLGFQACNQTHPLSNSAFKTRLKLIHEKFIFGQISGGSIKMTTYFRGNKRVNDYYTGIPSVRFD